jgi:hypothetical protein
VIDETEAIVIEAVITDQAEAAAFDLLNAMNAVKEVITRGIVVIDVALVVIEWTAIEIVAAVDDTAAETDEIVIDVILEAIHEQEVIRVIAAIHPDLAVIPNREAIPGAIPLTRFDLKIADHQEIILIIAVVSQDQDRQVMVAIVIVTQK